MEKPTYKLVGAPCGQQGQYTFYKALRTINGKKEKILAIGDFFFVRIWQDSELVSIGELQLLWTDRVSDQTLVSLRMYFLPENTPDGRSQHGEDEVLALSEKVVVRADDLLSWMCEGAGWRCGVRAVWRGACAPPASPAPSSPLRLAKLDFSDVDQEKSSIEIDVDSPGVVVFSYPRYCRYRALVARLEGMQSAWLRDSLVAALGGYAASTNNTTILYCKDTFEYPELEGHEFVCNHLAPRLKGRPRGRRNKRAHRSRSHTPSSRSSDSEHTDTNEQKVSPRRLSLRNGSTERASAERTESPEDRQFLSQLRQFYIGQGGCARNLAGIHSLKDLSLRELYMSVRALGGYDAVCRDKSWRKIHASRPTKARGLYVRYLRPYECHERSNGRLKPNGKLEPDVVTIHVPDSPRRGLSPRGDGNELNGKLEPDVVTIYVPDSPRRGLSPRGDGNKSRKCEKTEATIPTAEELNRQFLESISQVEGAKPLVSIKPPQLLIDPDKQKLSVQKVFEENSSLVTELTAKYNVTVEKVVDEVACGKLSDGSCSLLGEIARRLQLGTVETSLLKHLASEGSRALSSLSTLLNGHNATTEQRSRPAGRSSLRAVRVKPARAPPAAAPAAPSAPAACAGRGEGGSPPAPVTNFGIHHPPHPAPPPPPHNTYSDDEIVEVPYKPKTPEIIDLDEYPESPQSTKKKKLDILKERGLEVTAIPPTWGGIGTPPMPLPPVINPPLMLNPAMQHQIMTQASLFQMYNIIPQNYANGIQPPKVIQSSCLYGSSVPEKTVYGNPKDPFMPPPHVFHGTPIKTPRTITTEAESIPTRQDILDLTCKTTPKPAVEIVRIPSINSPSKTQNLNKNYTLIDGKAVVGSNLEITLVNPKSQTPPKNRQPQKRSSNGKFMSSKTPTPPRDFTKDNSRNYTSPTTAKSPTIKKNPINIPTYHISKEEISPTSSTSSRESTNLLQNAFKNQNSLAQIMDIQKGQFGQSLTQNLGSIGNLSQMMDMQKSVPLTPFADPMYMSALYSSIAGQMDQRQLAIYRDLMANQFRYSGLLGGVATPTTKN